MMVGISVNGGETSNVVVKEDEAVPQGFTLIPRSMGVSIDGPSVFEIRIAESALA